VVSYVEASSTTETMGEQKIFADEAFSFGDRDDHRASKEIKCSSNARTATRI
jgi:hypothetical protein